MLKLIVLFFVLFLSNLSFAQNFDERVKSFLDSAESAAQKLDKSAYENIVSQIRNAQDIKKIEEQLKQLKSQVVEVSENYNSESLLWEEHLKLVEFVKERKNYAQEKLSSSGKKAWANQIDKWDNHGKSLQELRVSLIKEADRADELADEFSDNIDLVVDIYLSSGVEQAINELKSVQSNFNELNNSLEGALTVAKNKLTPETGN